MEFCQREVCPRDRVLCYLYFFRESLQWKHDSGVRSERHDAQPVVIAHRLDQQLDEDLDPVNLRDAFVGAIRLAHAETGAQDTDEARSYCIRLSPRIVDGTCRGRRLDRA